MIIVIIIRLIGNCLISSKSSKGSSIYLSPSLFQSLSLIISITANISGINKQSQKLTLCADGRASLPYIKTPPGEPDGAFDLDLRVVLLDSCLSCAEACDRHAEGRAGNIIKADVVAELDGSRVAAVLTADTAVK